MQSMNPFISNELFSWMSIWSHELLVSDSGGQEEEKEEKEREWERHQCWFDHTLVWTSMPHFTFRIGNWKWKKTKRKKVLEYNFSILQYFCYSTNEYQTCSSQSCKQKYFLVNVAKQHFLRLFSLNRISDFILGSMSSGPLPWQLWTQAMSWKNWAQISYKSAWTQLNQATWAQMS